MINPITPATLRAWREARGLSRATAGALIRITRQTWGDMERRMPQDKPLKLGYVIALALWAVEQIKRE